MSVVVMTFTELSRVHLIRSRDSAPVKGWKYTLLSLLAGWWGVPRGLIQTPLAVYTCLCGGKDVTEAVVKQLQQMESA